MGKSTDKKIISTALSLILLIVLSLTYLVIPKKNGQQKSYFDLRTYPRAQSVQEMKLLEPGGESQSKLHSSDSVPSVYEWYLNNYVGTGWILDVPSENPADENIQQMRLAKLGYRLSISLIGDGKGGTDIIFEQIKKPEIDKPNK